MSKKNSKATRARILAADLARERALAAKRDVKATKRAAKAAANPLAGARRKPKGVKVKKGVRVKGIKVVDAESKKAAIAALRAAAVESRMAVDDGAAKNKDVVMK